MTRDSSKQMIDYRRWLSYAGVTERTSLSESTIRRLIREGRFPRPQPITAGRLVFEVGAVDAAVEALLSMWREKPKAIDDEASD